MLPTPPIRHIAYYAAACAVAFDTSYDARFRALLSALPLMFAAMPPRCCLLRCRALAIFSMRYVYDLYADGHAACHDDYADFRAYAAATCYAMPPPLPLPRCWHC